MIWEVVRWYQKGSGKWMQVEWIWAPLLTHEWFVRGEVEEMGVSWMDEWMDGWVDGRMNGRMIWMSKWLNEWLSWWMRGDRMNEGVKAWIDLWRDVARGCRCIVEGVQNMMVVQGNLGGFQVTWRKRIAELNTMGWYQVISDQARWDDMGRGEMISEGSGKWMQGWWIWAPLFTHEWFVRGEVEEMGVSWMDEWASGCRCTVEEVRKMRKMLVLQRKLRVFT